MRSVCTPLPFRAFARLRAFRLAALLVSVGAARVVAQEPFTKGDAAFMQGMIHHHAQALVMAGMASTHGASDRIVLLARKITLSQRDEIGFMRVWLQFRKQEVPDTAPHSQVMSMEGMDMSSSNMPGMLTEAQMKALDAARGVKFDSLFLTGMIGHHKGALKMVADLVNDPPSGQESEIFRFTTDVVTDQSAEIDVMQQMLYNLPRSTAP
jgi:uncharacterized protein (DUF305 family)